MRNSRSIIIVAVVLIVVVAAVAVWFIFLRGPSNTPAAPGTSTNGGLPTVGGQNSGAASASGSGNNSSGNSLPGAGGATQGSTSFGVVSSEPVLDYFVDAQNNAIIIEPDGKIATITAGTASFLNSTGVQDLVRASFSREGARIVANFGDPTNPQTSVFTVSKKTWTPLPLGILSPVWSPADNRIAYLKDNANGTLTLATLDISKTGAKPVVLLTLHATDLSLAWPTANQIVLSDKPSAYEEGSIIIFDISKKTLARPFLPVNGLEALWSGGLSPAILAFQGSATGRGGSLSFLSSLTSAPKPFTLFTLPSKCVFNTAASSTLSLYCAVPKDANGAFSNAALPDAYEQMGVFTTDNFYKVRTDTGDISTVLTPTQSIDATVLKVFGKTLFFINRYDQKLYAVSLEA